MWAKALSELRPRFDALAHTDLHALQIQALLKSEHRKFFQKSARAIKSDKEIGPLALPPAAEWQEDRPVIQRAIGGIRRLIQPIPIGYATDPSGRAPSSFNTDATHVYLRLVIYGKAARSWKRFSEVAGWAGSILRAQQKSRWKEADPVVFWLCSVFGQAVFQGSSSPLASCNIPFSMEPFDDDWPWAVRVKLTVPLPLASSWAIYQVIARADQRIVDSDHDERDRYLYECRKKGLMLKEILYLLRREHPNWVEEVKTVAGINQAIDRFSRRKGLPPLISPRKSKKQ
jgi:hypothetical protein